MNHEGHVWWNRSKGRNRVSPTGESRRPLIQIQNKQVWKVKMSLWIYCMCFSQCILGKGGRIDDLINPVECGSAPLLTPTAQSIWPTFVITPAPNPKTTTCLLHFTYISETTAAQWFQTIQITDSYMVPLKKQ